VHIVFATKPHLPVIGGAQLSTHFLAEELVARGHVVTVLAIDPPYKVDSPGGLGSFSYRLINSSVPERELSHLLAGGQADCVVVCGYHERMANWATKMLRAAGPVPTIFYLRDVAAVEVAVRAQPHIDRVVAASAFLVGRLRQLGVDATCIEPIVDRARYGVTTTRRVALLVNPVEQKGVEIVFALARARPDIPFAFALCWPLKDPVLKALRQKAARFGNVELRARVTDPCLLYGDARVLLVPSTYPEAWPRVAAEAQTSGIPVIGSNTGGVSEAAGGVGMFIDPDGPLEQWEQALTELWDYPARYEVHVTRAWAAAERECMTPSSVGARFEALVDDLRGVSERAA